MDLSYFRLTEISKLLVGYVTLCVCISTLTLSECKPHECKSKNGLCARCMFVSIALNHCTCVMPSCVSALTHACKVTFLHRCYVHRRHRPWRFFVMNDVLGIFPLSTFECIITHLSHNIYDIMTLR